MSVCLLQSDKEGMTREGAWMLRHFSFALSDQTNDQFCRAPHPIALWVMPHYLVTIQPTFIEPRSGSGFIVPWASCDADLLCRAWKHLSKYPSRIWEFMTPDLVLCAVINSDLRVSRAGYNSWTLSFHIWLLCSEKSQLRLSRYWVRTGHDRSVVTN